MTRKRYCDECDGHGSEPHLLVAPHPFLDGININGCPQCREIEGLRTACDEPECWDQDTCGTPMTGGYRRTCGKHVPQTINSKAPAE